MALGHGTDEDRNALLGAQRLDIVLGTDHGGVETHRHLTAVRGQMVGDRVLDDLEELLLRVGGANRQTVEQLDHQTGEPLEGSRNADGRVDLDQNTLGRVDEDLEAASLVDGGVQKSEETLETIVSPSFKPVSMSIVDPT